MLKNESSSLKKLAKEYSQRYKMCGFTIFETILFVRRLNNMGYVVVKSDDLEKYQIDKDLRIKKYIIPWGSLKKEKVGEEE